VTQAVMAGQVKHNKIFSTIRPDWKLAKLLFSLPRKNTDALIGAVGRVLEEEGIRLVDSTLFLKPLLPEAGVLTRRAPNEHEAEDIAYGRALAQQIAGMDIGQTVVIADKACVAVEAMEGTDQVIARAGRIAPGRPLVVVKVSKPGQDMRFDVPVIGLATVEHMRDSGATALAVDAGRSLLFDKTMLIELADSEGIAIQAFPPSALAEPKDATRGINKERAGCPNQEKSVSPSWARENLGGIARAYTGNSAAWSWLAFTTRVHNAPPPLQKNFKRRFSGASRNCKATRMR